MGHVGTGTWQLRGGTGIKHWQGAGDAAWTAPLRFPCKENADKPDRVVLGVWGHSGFDSAQEWAGELKKAIATIRLKRPSARLIVIQPAAGGPGCKSGYASGDLLPILAAAKMIEGNGVLPGAEIKVDSCSQLSNWSDDLSPEAARKVAETLGQFYKPLP